MKRRIALLLCMAFFLTVIPVFGEEEVQVSADAVFPQDSIGFVSDLVEDVETFDSTDGSETETLIPIIDTENADLNTVEEAVGAEGVEVVPSETLSETEELEICLSDATDEVEVFDEPEVAEDGNGIAIDERNFPDPLFRTWIQGFFGGATYITADDAASVTKLYVYTFDSEFNNIQSLQGIGFFPNLTELDCSNLSLSQLDLSGNANLQILTCAFNPLTSLNVSANTQLTRIYSEYCPSLRSITFGNNPYLEMVICRCCALTRLDVSGLASLKDLDCCECSITELLLPSGGSLEELTCNANPLSSLDISNCPNLNLLYCYSTNIQSLNISNNPILLNVFLYGRRYADNGSVSYYDSLGQLSIDAATGIITTPVPAEKTLSLTASSMTLGRKEKVNLLKTGDNLYDYSECSFSINKDGKNVVSVSKGVVTAKATGSATITIKTKDGKKKATCKVKVMWEPMLVKSIPKKKTLGIGQTLTLKPTFTNGLNKAASFTRTWTSSDLNVATVSGSGVVTAVGEGTAKITIKTFNNKKASCVVTVVPAPTYIAFEVSGKDAFGTAWAFTTQDSDTTLAVKQTQNVQLLYNCAGEGCVTYSVADTAVAKLSNGVLTGLKKGDTTITAKSYNGLSQTMTVHVVPAPTKISLSASSRKLAVGEKYTLVPTIPEGSMTTYTFTSGNKSVATVNKKGVITAKKAGTAKITVKTHNGKSATCTVTVCKATKSLSLNKKNVTISTNTSIELKPVFSKDAYATLTWASSDPSVAEVNTKGKVTAHKAGRTVITVTSSGGLTAKCNVTVITLKLNLKKKTMLKGREQQLTATLDPADANVGIQWSSSNTKVAKVSTSGLVTTVAEGKVVITATVSGASQTIRATCTVSVVPKNDYSHKVDQFLSNSNWKNGANWGDSHPQVSGSTWGSSGCYAYCVDFAHEVWPNKPNYFGHTDGNPGVHFTTPSDIRDGDVIHIYGGDVGVHYYVVIHRFDDGQLFTVEGNKLRNKRRQVIVSCSEYSMSNLDGFVEGWHMPGDVTEYIQDDDLALKDQFPTSAANAERP